VLLSQRYVRGVHRGPYQQSGATYKAIYNWVKSQGISVKNEAVEFCVNDPHAELSIYLKCIQYNALKC